MKSRHDDGATDARFARFRLAYPSGTMVDAYYCDGATLGGVRVTHPMAVVQAVDDSRVRRGGRAGLRAP